MAARGQEPSADGLRTTGIVARLYHAHGVRQREIAARLGVSQARVSRLLRQADELGIVRKIIAVPDGIQPELEEAVEERYGVPEVHVVDVDLDVEDVPSRLGAAAASYLTESGVFGLVVGFTSWSTTLQAMAHAIQGPVRPSPRIVVEMLGDLGAPARQHAAARATQAMARALGAEPVFLRAPGVVSGPEQRDLILADAHVARALGLLDRLDVAFVGVGPPAVHSRLEAGDRYFGADQLEQARSLGAVAQLNQRFLDAQGRALQTPLDSLVVGSTLAQVRGAGRRVVVAGGDDKATAIAAALSGGWVDLLITDVRTAQALVSGSDPGRRDGVVAQTRKTN